MIHQQKTLYDAMNYQKKRIIVTCIHEEIANKRNDYLHKVSTEIIEIEDLQVSNLLKNQSLAKAISEVSWLRFRTMFEYKEKWYGKTVMAVVKRISSSQLCSRYGYRNKDVMDLILREWVCPACNSCYDRDHNLSINFEKEAIRLLTAGTAELA